MLSLSIKDIAFAIQADYTGPDFIINSISTDSRNIGENCLFVALVGERVDGHEYIATAFEKGAAFVVAHKPVDGDDSRVLYVKDTFPVLMQIARLYRSRFDLVTVGITGSVGKTTTKEFVAAVVGKKYRTLKTEGNHNNEIGLPNTLFGLDEIHEAAVLEMGMDGLGDIAKLTDIVRPDIGVITNIGVSHLEHLGSQENILKAKMEIIEGMKDGAPLILNGDDPLLFGVSEDRVKKLYFGIDNPENHVRAIQVVEHPTKTTFTIEYNKTHYAAEIPAVGLHNVYNALAAFCVGICLYIPEEEILEALLHYTPSGMRQRMVDCRGTAVVEDCYNASPDSMKAALNTLENLPATGRKICVLADMLELGDLSEQAHYNVGVLCAEKGVDLLFAYGTMAERYIKGAIDSGLNAARLFDSKDQLAETLRGLMQPGDVIWVKGSRGMALEDVLSALYKD